MATATIPKEHVEVDGGTDDSQGDSTFVMEVAEQRPPTTNGEKLNASLRRIVNSAKHRALNTSVYRRQQTLKANNTALARSLSLAKEEIKTLRNKVMSLRIENQDLKTELAAANNNPLYEEAVREEVKTRVLEVLGDVEGEYGDVKTRFTLCAERMRQLSDAFADVSNLMGQCSKPMSSLGDMIKKHIDDAGEFLDDIPIDDHAVSGARKTMAAIRRKTRVEPETVVEAQQGVHVDKTDAPRRKTVALAVMDKMEEEDTQDDEPGNGEMSPKRVSLKDAVVSVPDVGDVARNLLPVKNNNLAPVPASRKTIGAPRKPAAEPEAREESKRKVEEAAERARRKTVAGRSVIHPAPKKIGRQDEAEEKTSPAKPTRVMSTRPVVLPKGDTIWEPPASPKHTAPRKSIVVSRPKTTAKAENMEEREDVQAKKKPALRKTVHYKDPPKESNEEDAFEEETVKIEPNQKASKRKASKAAPSKSCRSMAFADASTSGEDKDRKGSSGSQSGETGETENCRPRRHTAVASYKEPPLNNKLRRHQ